MPDGHMPQRCSTPDRQFAGGAASAEESLRIARAAEEQRVGFEGYIEARLEFSEFLLARDPEAGTGPNPGEDSRRRPDEPAPGWWSPRDFQTGPGGAGDCAALSGRVRPDFLHERKHVRELEAARDAMGAMLVQARSQVPERKPEEAPFASRDSGGAPVVPKLYQAPVRTACRARRTVDSGWPLPALLGRGADSCIDAQSGLQARLLRSLDQDGRFQAGPKRVKRYEPVWINLGGIPRRSG